MHPHLPIELLEIIYNFSDSVTKLKLNNCFSWSFTEKHPFPELSDFILGMQKRVVYTEIRPMEYMYEYEINISENRYYFFNGFRKNSGTQLIYCSFYCSLVEYDENKEEISHEVISHEVDVRT